jgi:CheY-like chemotaxis protein
MKKETSNELTVLIADDDPDELFLYQRAISGYNRAVKLEFYHNGLQLVKALEEREFGEHINHSKDSTLVIMDLKMPFAHGTKILAHLKSNPETRDIPVYIFSNSDSAEDKSTALAAGAKNFYKKPSTFHDLKRIFKELLDQVPH